MLGGLDVEFAFKRTNGLFVLSFFRSRGLQRRHLPRLQPPDHVLPRFEMLIDALANYGFQRKPGRFRCLVVTIKAMPTDELTNDRLTRRC
jgi:hypothetical protein